MGRLFNVIWVVLVLALLVFIGQTVGLYDVPALRELSGIRLFEQPVPAAVVPTSSPTAPEATHAARPLASPVSASSVECTSANPRFVHGNAALKALLGADMGDALECERIVDGAGDTEQKTTTGLAYYRAQSNTAAFTNGARHWAITAAGAVQWTGDSIEPPADAEPLP